MVEILLKDSMTTIQKKLNKGGDIHFQPGIYKITRQLIIPANTILHLYGAVLKRCGNIQSVFLNKCKTSTKQYNGAGNIRFLGGTIEGMGGYSYDNLITFFHSHDIELNGVTFLDTLCHAVELNACQNVVIKGCMFKGSNTKDAYKEVIQLDTAYTTGFWLEGSSKKSKCYDGTTCNNISITNNTFTRSDYRKHPTACIGTHTQIINGKHHTDIKILQNYFVCNGGNCISLIGMKDVQIFSNYFKGCSRAIKIFNKEESYTLTGELVKPGVMDGLVDNVKIVDNVCEEATGSVKCSGIYIDNINAAHIDVYSNKFVRASEFEKYYLCVVNCQQPPSIDVKNNQSQLRIKGV